MTFRRVTDAPRRAMQSDRGPAAIRERACATAPSLPVAANAPVHGAQAKPADAGAGA
jgi:hypothetical protein